MKSLKFSEEIEFLEDVLSGAGDILKSSFGNPHRVQTKPDKSLVTEADYASESFIVEAIQSRWPGDAIISEESHSRRAPGSVGQRVWIIDPLDGTTNFANRYPFFSVSIGLCEFDESGSLVPIAGGIEEPMRCRRFLSAVGEGSWLGDQRLRIRTERPFSECFLVTGFHYDSGDILRQRVQSFAKVASKCQSIRRDGSAALDLAYVAEGVYDGFWEYGLQLWDLAAGALIVSEAGGRLSNYDREVYTIEGHGVIAGSAGTVAKLKTEIAGV